MKLKQILIRLSIVAAMAITFALTGLSARAATIGIGTTALPSGTVGQSYSFNIQFSMLSAVPIYATFTGLPAGITGPTGPNYTNNAFGTGTVLLSGTPTTAGTYNVTMSLSDNGTSNATQGYTLVVNAAAGTPTTMPGYTVINPPVTINPPTPVPAPITTPAPTPTPKPAPAPLPTPSWAIPLLQNNQNPAVPAPTPAPQSPSAMTAAPISWPNGSLVKAAGGTTAYLVTDGILHPFPSAAIFRAKGLKFSDIQTITAAQFAAAQVGNFVTFPDGALLLGSNKTVYLVSGGKKLGIPSLAVFYRLNLSFKDVISVSDNDLAALPDGGVQN